MKIPGAGNNFVNLEVTDVFGQTTDVTIVTESGPIQITIKESPPDLASVSKIEVISIIPEGVDDDNDGFINEDPPGNGNEDAATGDTMTDEDGSSDGTAVEPPLVGATFGISQVDSSGPQLNLINSIVFSADSFFSKNFDVGFLASNGTIQSTPGLNLLVDAKFTDAADPDYLPSLSDLGFVDSGGIVLLTASNGLFDVGEPVYEDVDMSADVSIGDIRIRDTGNDNTTVQSGDADEIAAASILPLTPTNEKTYTVSSSGGGGYSSTGSATVKSDINSGIVSKECLSGDDTDADIICDSWETPGPTFGIPYRVAGHDLLMPFDVMCPTCVGISTTTANGNAVNLIDEAAVLAGTQKGNSMTPSLGIRDVYLEIDAMDLHPPDIRALNDVISLYADATPSPSASGPIALHIIMDEGRTTTSGDGLDHKALIEVWHEYDLRFNDD